VTRVVGVFIAFFVRRFIETAMAKATATCRGALVQILDRPRHFPLTATIFQIHVRHNAT
jgi:hypothetical protein